jgi:hypothetical protein
MTELTAWVNNRLEQAGYTVSRGSLRDAQDLGADFHVDSEEIYEALTPAAMDFMALAKILQRMELTPQIELLLAASPSSGKH